MSIQAQNWVIKNSRQTGSMYFVLLMIANHANAEGKKAFPSIPLLAQECRLSERQVRRIVAALARTPELYVVFSKGGKPSEMAIDYDAYADEEPGQDVRVETETNPVNLSGDNPDNMTGSGSENPDIDGDQTRTPATSPPTPPYKDNNQESKKICPADGQASAEKSDYQRLFAKHHDRLGYVSDPEAQGAVIKKLLKRHDLETCLRCYDYQVLELKGEDDGWRSSVSWLTVNKSIEEWVKAGKPRRPKDAGKTVSPDIPDNTYEPDPEEQRVYEERKASEPCYMCETVGCAVDRHTEEEINKFIRGEKL